MEGLNDLEQTVLDMLLAGEHPVLAVLRQQAAVARLVERDLTGVGFFHTFELPPEAPRLSKRSSVYMIGDVWAHVIDAETGQEIGATFILFIRDYQMSILEGCTHEPRWPEKISRFTAGYPDKDRDLSGLGEA